MKRFCRFFWFTLFVFFNASTLWLLSGVPSSGSRVNFGSRESAFKFASGATFNVSSANDRLKIDGTLVKDANAAIVGNDIDFNKGVLESRGSIALITGVYRPTGDDYIWLVGNSSFNAQPGIVIQKMYIMGNENRIDGQPLFLDSVDFYDASTSLTIAIPKLNKNLTLNGGKLRLEGDLHLGDNVFITGPGRVSLNNCQLTLGSVYATDWNTNIVWDRATDIVLTGRTKLSGQWYCNGDCVINGQGNVLDLSSGGTIYVAPGARLYLVDIELRGLGDGHALSSGQWHGKLLMGSNSSQIRTYDSSIELVENYTTTVGNIYVEGPTTFILKDKNWLFNNTSKLTVDGVTLWLDTLDNVDWPMPGQLEAPLPVYAGHYWQANNVAYDLAHNLDLINSGTVREVCDRSQGFSSITTALTSPTLTTSLDLDQSVHIHPFQRINIGNRITIDGHGATIVFSNPANSQFIVRPGQSVTLKNIEFDRINENTFDLRWNIVRREGAQYWDLIEGKIIIGENVVFGMSENITFSQGLLEVILQSNGAANIFYVRGVDGQKRLVFNPTSDYKNALMHTNLVDRISSYGYVGGPDNPTPVQVPILLKLNQNEMALQAMNLFGIEFISRTIGYALSQLLTGGLGLVGGASVDIGNQNYVYTKQEKLAGVKESYDMVYDIEGLDNKIRLLKDDMVLSGKVLYASQGENELHIDSLLTERIIQPVDDPTRTIPLVNFGTGFISLTSDTGMARLFFDDAKIRIKNASNAFLVYKNSYLSAKHLEVTGDFIYDLYDPTSSGRPFVIEAEDLVALSDLHNTPIAFSQTLSLPMRGMFDSYDSRFPGKITTALQLLYEKNKAKFLNKSKSQQEKNSVKPQDQPKMDSYSKPRPKRGMSELLNKSIENLSLTRSIIPPDPNANIVTYSNLRNLDMNNSSGNFKIDYTTATNFSIKSTDAINFTLNGNSALYLTPSADVSVKDGDIINIVGNSNEIHIYKTLNIYGRLCFDTGAQLKIVFETPSAAINFKMSATQGRDNTLTLENNSILSVAGNGTISFDSGYKISLNGQALSSSSYPIFLLTEYAVLNPLGTLTIKGIGNVNIATGAKVNIIGSENLIIGDSSTDQINLNVFDSGLINLAGSTSYAKLVFIKGRPNNFNIYQGGILAIQNMGWVEINSLNSVVLNNQGNFNMNLDPDGFLFLHSGGQLSFANNYNETYGTSKTYINWSSKKSFINGNGIGDGVVTYISDTTGIGFSGKIRTGQTQIFFSSNSLPTLNLVRTFINEVSTLTNAIIFTTASGVDTLRLKNGRQVAITSGDTLTTEDTTGNVSGTTSTNKKVVYKLDGTRNVS